MPDHEHLLPDALKGLKFRQRSLHPELVDLGASQQGRAETRQSRVIRYAGFMRDGTKMPPVLVAVVKPSSRPLVIDGWHRLLAAKMACQSVEALVFALDRTTYIRACIQVNAAHGLELTARDNDRRLELAHMDPEWRNLSNRKLAAALGGITKSTVNRYRLKHGIVCARDRDEEEEHEYLLRKERTLTEKQERQRKLKHFGTLMKSFPNLPHARHVFESPGVPAEVASSLIKEAFGKGSRDERLAAIGKAIIGAGLEKKAVDAALLDIFRASAWLLQCRLDESIINGGDGAEAALAEWVKDNETADF